MDRLRAHLSYANVMATLAFFVAVGGTAFANVSASGPRAPSSAASGPIRACVQAGTGIVRIVQRGTRCGRNETALSWNIAGPTGKAGPRGVAGPKGDTGAPGPAGQNGQPGVFSGHFASPSGTSTVDVTDSGITLRESGTSGTSSVTLSGGGVAIDAAQGVSTVAHTGNVSTTATLGDVTTTATLGALTNAAGQSVSDTVGTTKLALDASSATLNGTSGVSLGGTGCTAGVARVGDTVFTGSINSGSAKVTAC